MSSFRIRCSHCGWRPASEFTCGGDVVSFPPGGVETDEENYARVWLERNSLRRQSERWFHVAGCRRWSTVDRDRLSNEVVNAGHGGKAPGD